MTTTGLTLRFQRDDDGDPRVLYICDRLGVCGLCRHEVIERIYADTSYHHLTVARFRLLAAQSALAFDQTCEQCGESLHDEHVARTTITYGFPQDLGLLQAFTERDGDERRVVYALSPYRELDGQMQPEWQPPDDQSVAVLEALTEVEVRALMGRFLSVKAGWRRLLRLYREHESQGVAVLQMAPGCWGLVGPSPASVQRRFELLRDERRDAQDAWVTADLADPINRLIERGPDDWLPDGAFDALAEGRPYALAACDLDWAAGALRIALERLPVATSCTMGPAYEAEVGFPIGAAEPYVVYVSLRALLLEALVLGASPSDWLGLWLDERLVEVTGDPR